MTHTWRMRVPHLATVTSSQVGTYPKTDHWKATPGGLEREVVSFHWLLNRGHKPRAMGVTTQRGVCLGPKSAQRKEDLGDGGS